MLIYILKSKVPVDIGARVTTIVLRQIDVVFLHSTSEYQSCTNESGLIGVKVDGNTDKEVQEIMGNGERVEHIYQLLSSAASREICVTNLNNE